MINRSLDCYVFDTKQFNNRLKITDDGGFLRWNEARQKHETVPSPLLQNDRNMPVLKEILAEVFTPERVGKRIKPTLPPWCSSRRPPSSSALAISTPAR